MVLQKVAGGYKNPSKIPTNAPKRFKYGLKWSIEDTLDYPWCTPTFFLKSMNKGAYQLAFQISKLNEMNSNADDDQLSNTYQFILFVIEIIS